MVGGAVSYGIHLELVSRQRAIGGTMVEGGVAGPPIIGLDSEKSMLEKKPLV